MVVFIIISCLLWVLSFVAVFRKILVAPALSYLGLLSISFADQGGYPLIPINGTILWGWLAMTVVVMVVTMLQPEAMNSSRRGVAYIFGGAIAGMAIGLLGYTVSYDISLLYGIMVAATVAGAFFGYLLYTRTPDGRSFVPGSGVFFKYLMAKGFPVALTVMQLGVVLVILLALHNIGSL